jgi:hypothetical protein
MSGFMLAWPLVWLSVALAVAPPALVEANQMQSCVREVAEQRNLEIESVHLIRTQPNSDRRGVTNVDVNWPGGRATCLVDLNFSVLAIEWTVGS